MQNLANQIVCLLVNEDGDMKDLVWTVGAAVVVALIIIGAMVYAPQTAQTMWQAAVNWIRSSFGF